MRPPEKEGGLPAFVANLSSQFHGDPVRCNVDREALVLSDQLTID